MTLKTRIIPCLDVAGGRVVKGVQFVDLIDAGDPVEAAKGLRDFAKANPALVIKGGVLDGRTLTAAEVTKLADLESREVLLAKAAGAMKAKLYQAAYVFTANTAQAARVIDALRQKQESEGAAA